MGRWVVAGSVIGFLAVALGALAAHGLEARVKAELMTPRQLEVFQTGCRYAMYHALALVLVGSLAGRLPAKPLDLAGWAFLVGVILFSGSLWAYGLSGIKWLGMITPFGGLAFLAGWIFLAAAGYGGKAPGGA